MAGPRRVEGCVRSPAAPTPRRWAVAGRSDPRSRLRPRSRGGGVLLRPSNRPSICLVRTLEARIDARLDRAEIIVPTLSRRPRPAHDYS